MQRTGKAMTRTKSNVEFAVFGDTAERSGPARRKSAAPHMRAEARMALYLTIAGLIEGGYAPSAAAELVANEYQASGKRMEAVCVSTFFADIEKRTSADMGEIVSNAFGKNFVSVEEMALLRSLPQARDMAPILRMAASIVGLQYHVGEDRVSTALRRN